MVTPTPFRDLPLLSLRAYRHGGKNARLEFLDGLQKSWDSRYGGQGFGKFIEPILSPMFMDILLSESQAFFEGLSTEQKEKYNLHCRGQRGYTGFGVEGAKDRSVGDLKEMLMWGRNGIPGEVSNIYPQELPQLLTISMYVYEKIEEDNHILYKALAEMLDVDQRYFEWDWQEGRNPNSSLRSLYYPPVSKELIERVQRESGTNAMPVRAAEHGDINRVTWLYLGKSSEGLQIKQQDGSWENVFVGKEIAIVNVGDILSTETDGILPSAIHRVLAVHPEEGRYSFPCFTHPAKGKHLRRLLTNANAPGRVYRNAFAEVYRPDASPIGNTSILRILHPEVVEYLGTDTLRIKYDHFLERRLADTGVFNDDNNLKERILKEFANRIPALTELEPWEMLSTMKKA